MAISHRCLAVCFWAGEDENHGCPQCSEVSSIPSRTWVDIFYWFILSTRQWHWTPHGLRNCLPLQQYDRQWRSFTGSGHASPTPSSLLVTVSIFGRQLGQRSWCKFEWFYFVLMLYFHVSIRKKSLLFYLLFSFHIHLCIPICVLMPDFPVIQSLLFCNCFRCSWIGKKSDGYMTLSFSLSRHILQTLDSCCIS